jgi:hypothetical protein
VLVALPLDFSPHVLTAVVRHTCCSAGCDSLLVGRLHYTSSICMDTDSMSQDVQTKCHEEQA